VMTGRQAILDSVLPLIGPLEPATLRPISRSRSATIRHPFRLRHVATLHAARKAPAAAPRTRLFDEPLRLRAGPRRPEMALQTHHRFPTPGPGRPRNLNALATYRRPHLKAQAAKID